MSDDTPVSGDDSNVVHVPTSDTTPLDPREAAYALTDYRRKRDAAPEPKAEAPATAAEPEPNSSQEVDAAPAEATGDQPTETTEPESAPPIEPPRSWTKEEKAEFLTYPREAQEKIARREQDRETSLRRGQNETAEQRKALETERKQVEQARTQYENALPQLLQTLHQQQQGEFSDIRTMSDVEKLAREDWPRYALWDAQQKKIAAVSQEMKAAEQRQQQEQTTKWSQYASKQDAALIERVPELADSEKSAKAAKSIMEMLKDIGYSDDELSRLWNGNEVFRDHRTQLMMRDAARWRDAQKAAPSKIAKPVPPVQRPGTSAPKSSADDVQIKNLEKKLEQSGSWKDAAALMVAKRAARR